MVNVTLRNLRAQLDVFVQLMSGTAAHGVDNYATEKQTLIDEHFYQSSKNSHLSHLAVSPCTTRHLCLVVFA